MTVEPRGVVGDGSPTGAAEIRIVADSTSTRPHDGKVTFTLTRDPYPITDTLARLAELWRG